MANEDRDSATPGQMTAFERRCRLLLRAYPAAYRRERGEEIIGTLLEATPAGRSWPRLCDARALMAGGLRARATQNRQLTTAANLRVAVMVGAALYLSVWVASYLGNAVVEFQLNWPAVGWPALPAVLTALAVAAAVVLAWTGSRRVALAGALAAVAAICYFVLLQRNFAGPAVIQLASLAGLVALIPRTARPSRKWLWLFGVVAATAVLPALPEHLGTFDRVTPGTLVLAIGVISLAWIGIDARLALAFLTYFMLLMLETEAISIVVGPGLGWLLPLPIVAVIAAPAIWLLRRQSAPRARSS
jgi:hypothetical protein